MKNLLQRLGRTILTGDQRHIIQIQMRNEPPLSGTPLRRPYRFRRLGKTSGAGYQSGALDFEIVVLPAEGQSGRQVAVRTCCPYIQNIYRRSTRIKVRIDEGDEDLSSIVLRALGLATSRTPERLFHLVTVCVP